MDDAGRNEEWAEQASHSVFGQRGKGSRCAKLRAVADAGVPLGTSRTDAAMGDKADGPLTRRPYHSTVTDFAKFLG